MFVLAKLLQSSLIFVSKARSLPLCRAPERYLTQIGCGLTWKHYTRLEKFAEDKHSGLLQKFVKYDCKCFITMAPVADVIKL